ncbi:MAG: flavodoxin family protein [Candidatus Woesebacteria bacterium]|jgi:flavodoxin
MKSLVVYCSAFGNTKKVAQAMAEEVGTKAIEAQDFTEESLKGLDLLFVGSPTQGGRPLPVLTNKIKSFSQDSFAGLAVATYDTRFAQDGHGWFLKILTKTIGYAAEKLANSLKDKDANIVGEPAGFIVDDKEGPLARGELERAKKWAKQICNLIA